MASIMARRIVGRSTPSHVPAGFSSCLDPRRKENDHETTTATITRRQIIMLGGGGSAFHPQQPQQRQPQYRLYHATSKQEILPLVAVAVVGGIGYYSYRALQRMDADWEDYQWELQQYEKKYGPVHPQDSTSSSTNTNTNTNNTPLFAKGTLGIDLGTRHLVLAHKQQQHPRSHSHSSPPPTTNNNENAQIVPTREGARYTYNGILYHPDENSSPLVGKLAFEKASYSDSNQVRYPTDDHDPYDPPSILHVTQPALQNALETRVGTTTTAASSSSSFSFEGVRPVVALPPSYDHAVKCESAFQSFLPDTTTFVPEPVAAVWGAEAQTLMDNSNKDSGPVVVIDVGGTVTTCSAVQKNQVCDSVTLPNTGGELWTHTLVDSIVEDHKDDLCFLDQDEMAQQRLYQAATVAIAEYNTSNQAHIHIPYISMNIETRQAQHLDTKVSRGVLEQKVQQRLKEILASSDFDDQGGGNRIFSPHVPPPTDYASLWTSVLIQLLEQINVTPLNVETVLLVGGGAKQPLIVSSLQQSWMALTGGAGAGADNVLVIPELAKRSELVALGAASLPSHHQYDPEQGIVVP